MSQIEETIEVQVPVTTAYNQWTQFEMFPKFMKGVDEVRQIDETHMHWKVSVAGRTKEYDAVITEQIPDTRIAWKSTNGPDHAGAVDFHRIDDTTTQVTLIMDGPDESVDEKVANATGVIDRRVRGDLKGFKELIEARGQETGAWRGSVDRPGT